jgi:hypothetical protein
MIINDSPKLIIVLRFIPSFINKYVITANTIFPIQNPIILAGHISLYSLYAYCTPLINKNPIGIANNKGTHKFFFIHGYIN